MSDMSSISWTEDRVELLKKLWADGLSASQIAAEMGGVTRNAVIGKVHRLGLSGRAKSPSTGAPRPRKPSTRAPSHPLGVRHHHAVRGNTALAPAYRPDIDPFAVIMPVAREDVVVPMSERVTITELREAMCRWPLGDPTTPEFRFCGAKSDIGTPYCLYHGRIAYQPATDRRRDRRFGGR
jgi:GcrA cell cycle regulator